MNHRVFFVLVLVGCCCGLLSAGGGGELVLANQWLEPIRAGGEVPALHF